MTLQNTFRSSHH